MKRYDRQRGQRPTEKPNKSGKRKAVKRGEKEHNRIEMNKEGACHGKERVD